MYASRVRRVALIGWGAWVIASCTSGNVPIGTTCDTDDDCAIGWVCDDGQCEEAVAPDTDHGDDTDQPLPGGPGGLGDPCPSGDSDCKDGYTCIPTAGGKICSLQCDLHEPATSCEDDAFECQLLNTGNNDLVPLCVPRFQHLCQPCTEDATCGGPANLCVLQTTGRACAVDCSTNGICPTGYSCEQIMRNGDVHEQCVPSDGLCGTCVDLDNDGYGAPGHTEGCREVGVDCDDDDARIHPGAFEACNGVDDDCDGVIDNLHTNAEGVYFRTEACGSCTTSCYAPGVAVPECVVHGGVATCLAAECEDGFADCDANSATCETDLSGVNNCGRCGNRCVATNAQSAVCIEDSQATGGYRCELSCNPNYFDCDGNPENGCEAYVLTDVNHCGGCGIVCAQDGSIAECRNGVCDFTTCEPGFQNCDNDFSNGCETPLDDDAHCGACGNVCGDANVDGASTCEDANGDGQFECVFTCKPGFADCNGIAADGCEVDLLSDVAHCGACGASCEYDNATMACDGAGGCIFQGCEGDFRDCNGDMNSSISPNDSVLNGCEVNVAENVSACGACGVKCNETHADAVACIEDPQSPNGFVCDFACEAGFDDCDGNPNNGCETDTETSVLHCGACGVACHLPNAEAECDGGACAIKRCNVGFADCNGVVADGCEVDLTDPNHCGGCGRVCDDVGLADGPECRLQGNVYSCVATCAPGFGDCDGNPVNGCEVDLSADDNNCGACGDTCGARNAATECVGLGICAFNGCMLPFGDCNGDMTPTFNAAATRGPNFGCEQSLDSLAHCGACGAVCSNAGTQTSTCEPVPGQSGHFQCALTCRPGQGDCDGDASNGCEASFASDRNHCGGCGIVCDYANGVGVCTGGTCALLACDEGWADCDGNPANGCEADLSQPSSCGACGVVCDPTNVHPSVAGKCMAISPAPANGPAFECPMACLSGFEDCDGSPNNGCESQPANDDNNCGACGKVCAAANASFTCQNFQCRFDGCDANFGDCDGNLGNIGSQRDALQLGNGCEVELVGNPTHCGSCGNDCANAGPGSFMCDVDTCRVSACAAPWFDCDGDGLSCESDLTSVATCGSCSTNCLAPSNATGDGNVRFASCNAGPSNQRLCGITECQAGFGDCNGQWSDGCEISFDAPVSCGAACGALENCTTKYPNAAGLCSARQCAMGACNAGHVDVDRVASNGCECTIVSTTDRPSTSGPFVDENCDGVDGTVDTSIFVAANGVDSATCGTMAAPCRTIQRGINRATSTGKTDVLIARGVYVQDTTLVLANGVSLHGGYQNDGALQWSRSAALDTVVRVSANAVASRRLVAVSGSGISSATTIARLTIDAQTSVSGEGISRYGLHCTNCGGLTIDNASVDVGSGTDGAAGTPGASASSAYGAPGVGGAGASIDCGGGDCSFGSGHQGGAGGAGGAEIQTCGAYGTGSMRGGAGGKGGNECTSPTNGANGASVGTAVGGLGGASGAPGVSGTKGGDGVDGDAGANGSNAPAATVVSGWLEMTSATAGAHGRFGTGGAGGGGGGAYKKFARNDGPGFGGSGGGAGGCGGQAGTPGTSGGHAVGLMFVGAGSPSVTSTTIRVGSGGAGGRGGSGGDGHAGAAGGPVVGASCSDLIGSTPHGYGGAGGRGGRGGKGGGGGHGAGGHAIGVVTADGASATNISSANDFDIGSAGTSNGVAGVRAELRNF